MNSSVPNASLVPVFPAAVKLEKTFDIQKNVEWLKNNHHYSIYFSLVYLLAVQIGQTLMRNKQPFSLKWPMVIWNFTLSLLSICGAIRTNHALFHALYFFGFKHTICDNRYIWESPVLTFWMAVFIVSKVLELFDTMFVVLRKQKLTFLHWFHHSSVLMFSWFTAAEDMAMGRWFISLNFTVHSFMYSYYTLRALKVKIPRQLAMFITSLQLTQMIIGFYIGMVGLSHYFSGDKNCAISRAAAFQSITVYVFYFLLFGRFFAQAYIKPNISSSKMSKNE